MKVHTRVAFGVCGALLLILPGTGPKWMDVAFPIIGVAYVLLALWWPQPKGD